MLNYATRVFAHHEAHDFLIALVSLLELGVAGLDDLTPTVPAAYREPWDVLATVLKGKEQ